MLKYGLLLFFFVLIFYAFLFLLLATTNSAALSAEMSVINPRQRDTEQIPVIDVRDFGYAPISMPVAEESLSLFSGMGRGPASVGSQSSADNPYTMIQKIAPSFLYPAATAHYAITLTNYDSITHTYHLTDTLPPQLAFVSTGSITASASLATVSTRAEDDSRLTYDPETHALHWTGAIAPGHLDYVIEESPVHLPYLDLAQFGAVDLCASFIEAGQDCDDVSVTFNLGINGYHTFLYGEKVTQFVVNANGIVLAGDVADRVVFSGDNQWLPDANAPNLLLAGLWRDVDMGGVTEVQNGRFHAAILQGLVEGQDIFYAQWHDAPHDDDPNLTARHAIAIPLQHVASETRKPVGDQLYFIYENVSDSDAITVHGYTIGLEDRVGRRGVTYAYAGEAHEQQGHPPPAGTTLQLRPVLFGTQRPFQRTFTYDAVVHAQVPQTIVNTAVVTTNNSAIHAWATHYLQVRWQTYLPFLRNSEVQP